MKGQSSMEFILLFVISLIVFIPILFQTNDVFVQKRTEVSITQAQNAVNTLADAVDILCVQPKDSKLSLLVYIPAEYDNTQSSLLQKTIQLVVKGKEVNTTIYANTKCDINGTLPPTGGQYKFEVKNTGENVTINPRSV